MRCYDYSFEELEDKATELLIEFDEQRLQITKPLDVYAVIEKCLDVPYDWKYLTPDQSILGMTAFNEGYIWVWPDRFYIPGMEPYKVYAKKGTIIIDATLTEENNRGRENFTVMHEVFHQVLHKNCFKDEGDDYIHATYSRTLEGAIRCKNYALKIIERQANVCAAAFLMPRNLTTWTYMDKFNDLHYENYDSMTRLIKEMADEFNVSSKAMYFRLMNLGLITENKENLLEMDYMDIK